MSDAGPKSRIHALTLSNTAHDRRRSDPTRADTDLGGVKDGYETRRKADPTDVRSTPANPTALRIIGGRG